MNTASAPAAVIWRRLSARVANPRTAYERACQRRAKRKPTYPHPTMETERMLRCSRGISVRVSLTKSGRSFSVAPGQPVLDAALDAGLNLPHSCKGGNCGACRARLLHGQVHYPNGRPLGLADTEVAEGLVLLCQARADTELTIETFERGIADQAQVKRLPSRVEHLRRWSHDVMGVFLRLPAAERFDFLPGQYIDILLPGGRRRSFSIASPPHDARLLELHVRRVPGGEFTEQLFG